MVLVPVPYPVCQQTEAVYRHSKATDSTQRYRCTAYRHKFQLPYRQKVHAPRVRGEITAMALNGSGMRDTARGLGISAQTVMGELKEMTK